MTSTWPNQSKGKVRAEQGLYKDTIAYRFAFYTHLLWTAMYNMAFCFHSTIQENTFYLFIANWIIFIIQFSVFQQFLAIS